MKPLLPSRRLAFRGGKESVVSFEKQLDQDIKFSNNLAERRLSPDIMQSKKNMEERIEDLIKTTMPVLPVSSFVEFVSTSNAESLSLGFTKFSETNLQGSTVGGLDQNFQANVEAELLICLKTSEGENGNTQHTDRVEVHIDPMDQVRSLAKSEKEDDHFLAEFVAETPGAYEIGVEINGQKLATSPFTIPVKSRKLNIAGKLDLQGAEPNGLAGIAVNSKGVVAVAECKSY